MTTETIAERSDRIDAVQGLRILTNQTKREHPGWLTRVHLLPGWEAEIRNGKNADRWQAGDLLWGWRLFRASSDVDAVVTGSEHSSLVFNLLQSAFRKRPVPHVCIYTHWNLPKPPILRAIRICQHRIQASSVNRFIVYSKTQLDRYVEATALPTSKFAVVPYHTTLYEHPVIEPSPLAERYIFSGGDFTRDYGSLIAAVRDVPCKVIIAARSHACFARLDMPANVHVTTTSPSDFFRLMAGAAAVVLPLRGGLLHSGGQQTFLNAMALARPVIVADDCGAHEYITNGVDGFVTKPGDITAISLALERILNDSEFARRLGENARATALRYSPERFFEEVLQIVTHALTDR
jgi:glycosyltransferase involved in cell wall biosynthesis